MDPDYKRMTTFLKGLGTDEVQHSDKSFLGHLIGVHRDLERWGCPQHVCRAGMFHSIYGTELFQRFSLPVSHRDEVRELIGPEAEQLGYLNCAMDRPSFDALVAREPVEPPYDMKDRLTGETHSLAQQVFDELCTLHLCDWLEQVERSGMWDYRREPYRNMARYLGGIGQQKYDEVFAREPVQKGT